MLAKSLAQPMAMPLAGLITPSNGFPALYFNFAVDGNISPRIGPSPTFTRATTGTFIGSNGLIQTAAIDAARFDYSPSTLASRGLIIEAAATNLAQYSQNPSNAYWEKYGGSIIATNTVAPDGTSTASTFRESSSNEQSIGREMTLTIGTTYTFSIYVKKYVSAPQRRFVQFSIATSSASNTYYGVVVDLTTGLVTMVRDTTGAQATTNKAYSITDHGLYYRISVTAQCVGYAGMYVYLAHSNSATPSLGWRGRPSYAGDSTSTSISWGFQIQTGTTLTTYTPTTGAASVTRSADVCTLNIPSTVSRIRFTYDDLTTGTQRVPPGGTYALPSTTKRYKEIRSYAPLPDDQEYFARASITDPTAQAAITNFIAGAKSLGIWDDMVYVPCLPAVGGLHQLGGSVNVTDTPWTLVNGSSISTGVSITNSGYSNYLLSQQTIPSYATTPVTFGTISCQNQTVKTVEQTCQTAALLGTDSFILGMASAGSPALWHVYYANGNLVGPYTPLTGEQVNNTYRNSHLSAASFNGTTRYDVLVDNGLSTPTHGSPITGGNAKMRFYPPCGTTKTGWIQGAFIYYGVMSTLGQTVWGKFRALINQTLLSGLTAAGNRRILISGQSNGVDQNLSIEFSRQAVGEAMGPTELFRSGSGGIPISNWIGAVGSNARSAQYTTDFWNSAGAGPPFQSTRLVGYGTMSEYLIWFQGESDTETAATAAAYRAQLATLINYFRADTGNPDLKVIVVQIDYNYTLRDDNSGGFFSNLTLTNFTGGLSALNGTYTTTTLTSNSDPYVWTKTGYKVEERSNQWVFVETAGNTVVASAVETNLPHPAMVTNWVDASSNAITPSFGSGNRTEWIERIRYAQREICNDLDNVFTFDSRGYTRTDGVHIDDAAHITFATDIGAYLLTI